MENYQRTAVIMGVLSLVSLGLQGMDSIDYALPGRLQREGYMDERGAKVAQLVHYVHATRNKTVLNDRDFVGLSPLDAAISVGNEYLVHEIVHLTGDALSQNIHNITPLMIACVDGHDSIGRFFIDRGIDPNAQDSQGQTALMLAAMYGHESTIEMLQKAGADSSIHDERGLTALDYAKSRHHYLSVLQLLHLRRWEFAAGVAGLSAVAALVGVHKLINYSSL